MMEALFGTDSIVVQLVVLCVGALAFAIVLTGMEEEAGFEYSGSRWQRLSINVVRMFYGTFVFSVIKWIIQ